MDGGGKEESGGEESTTKVNPPPSCEVERQGLPLMLPNPPGVINAER